MNLRFVWKLVKILTVIIMSVVTVIALCICIYLARFYLKEFRPYISQMQAIIQNAPSPYHDPPQVLLRAADVTLRKDRLPANVTSMMMDKFKIRIPRHVYHQVYELIWSYLLDHHFTENDILVLWCLNVYYKGGIGVSDAAYRHFGRDIDQLSPQEMITILVLPDAPSYYIDNPEALRKRVERHLAEYNARYGSDHKKQGPPDS